MALFPWRKKSPLIEAEQQRLITAIQYAEGRTTGEIRIFLERHCEYVDPMDRAVEIFNQLGMFETERRNAVLIYLAWKDHQFALFGDEQIYIQAGGEKFWAEAAGSLRDKLKQGELCGGLEICIQQLGSALAAHFPYDPEVQRNELPDEIVFGH